MTNELAEAAGLRAGERVLDLACGVGSTASHLSRRYRARVTGLDSDPEFLTEARERDPEVAWVLGDAEAIPCPDGSFDVVFAECFLSTFADPGPALNEVRRVLRPGGRLALSDVYLRELGATALGERVPAATCLSWARGREAGLAAVKDAGFEPLEWRDRSEALKVLMAKLIMEYGSADAFWEAASGDDGRSEGDSAADCGEADRHSALAAVRPGYFLLVARAQESGGV